MCSERGCQQRVEAGPQSRGGIASSTHGCHEGKSFPELSQREGATVEETEEAGDRKERALSLSHKGRRNPRNPAKSSLPFAKPKAQRQEAAVNSLQCQSNQQ
jgi:hypothetical protein